MMNSRLVSLSVLSLRMREVQPLMRSTSLGRTWEEGQPTGQRFRGEQCSSCTCLGGCGSHEKKRTLMYSEGGQREGIRAPDL